MARFDVGVLSLRPCLSLIAITFAAAPIARADEAAEILVRAVKASAGSEETLARRKYCVTKQNGVIHLPTGAAPATREGTMALPDRGKWVISMRPTTGPVNVTIVLNGLRGWSKNTADVVDLAPSQYDAVQNEAYTMWLASLQPFNSRSLKWELLKEAIVDGRATRVLKATQPNRPAVTLFFDRENFLLLKATYAGTENLQPVVKEFVFSAHKEFDGQRLPGKVQVFEKGKKLEEWTNESVRFPSSLDEREFSKP
jgi:hypothetical protein